MPADPVAAGRKGGKSRSAKKLAAARRNGFQPRTPDLSQPTPEARSILDNLQAAHGEDFTAQVLQRFRNRLFGFEGVNNPWRLFVNDAAALVAELQNEPPAHVEPTTFSEATT